MIKFGKISEQEFLANYWQKKPLLIKQALPDFISPIEPDELAGLSLEEEFESRLITGSIDTQQWSLINGAFSETDFEKMPEKNWTLLVQGVDRFIPEVEALITNFNFIPRWRFDDVMISYAAKGGSVGPHFDYYDVFLLQGSSKRRWELSTQFCNLDNYLKGVPLRIMDKFIPEQSFEVEPGDVLYIPPKIAHHGVSLDDECISISFGYRAYSVKEMYEHLNKDCPAEQINNYYQDPCWINEDSPALIPDSAITKANEILAISANEFAKFATKLDILDSQILQDIEFNIQGKIFDKNATYKLHNVCKIAYLLNDNIARFFINGELINLNDFNTQDVINFCNNRLINSKDNKQLSRQLFDLNLTYEK